MIKADDRELLNKLKKGNDMAFESLFKKYHRLVVSIAYQILKDDSLVEDITQDVFLKVYEKRESIKPRYESSFRNYIAQIARNKAIDHIRKRNSNKNLRNGLKTVSLEAVTNDEFGLEEASVQGKQHEDIEKRELNQIVLKEMKKMPKKNSLYLIYKYIYGMKDHESAKLLKVLPKSVSAETWRSSRILESRLAGYVA
ncbi:RNA polymerase sigma factor [Candidatus Woesearchaeota archaeon]|nr:RNA polymerase sigma factor [Candidatus Woesearchaeota archaeon]